jgi:DNA-binding CsgD family transcriptional regulator
MRAALLAIAVAADVGDAMCESRAAMLAAEIDCSQGRAAGARDAIIRLQSELSERAPAIAADLQAAAGKAALALADLDAAQRELTVAARLAHARSDPWAQAECSIELAEVAVLDGKPDRARSLIDDAMTCARALGDGWLLARATLALARAERIAGDLERARRLAHDALGLQRDGGYQLAAIASIETIAALLITRGDHVPGARLFGAADAARDRLGSVRHPADVLRGRDDRALLKRSLDTPTLELALRDGARLTLEEAIAYANRGRGEHSHGWGGLTPTELEVTRLVVDGLTNPQIAERMLVSRATVKAHLARIFRKIGVSHRAQLAATAARRLGDAPTPARAEK